MIIKICGVKTKDILITCENNSVNFYGMIFYKNSPRNINNEEARNLQKISENLNINGVGVFVDEELKNIMLLSEKLNLKYVQLHGNEDNNYIKNIKEKNIKVIKKISISDKVDLNSIMNFKSADYYLFDYKPTKGELPGGNAKSFNWSIVENLKIDKPWFLSGGINLQNIRYITNNINPHGIDLSSGVEKEVGIKDNVMINKLISNLKDA